MVKKQDFHPLKKIKQLVKKVGTLNLVLILMFIFFIWCIFRECMAIPETYACAVVAATIGEAGICGWIRTTKDRNREHKWELEEKKDQEEKMEVGKDDD